MLEADHSARMDPDGPGWTRMDPDGPGPRRTRSDPDRPGPDMAAFKELQIGSQTFF